VCGDMKLVQRVPHASDDVFVAAEHAVAAGEVEKKPVRICFPLPLGTSMSRSVLSFSTTLTPAFSQRQRGQCNYRREAHHPSRQGFKRDGVFVRIVRGVKHYRIQRAGLAERHARRDSVRFGRVVGGDDELALRDGADENQRI